MSWDSYVDTLKGYSVNGAISEGAIVGKDDGALWTTETENLKPLDGQALKLIVGRKSESITINGVRFMYLRVLEDDDGTFQILYKKKDIGSLCVAVTGKTIIVSLTPEAMSYASGESNEATRKIAAHLIAAGY